MRAALNSHQILRQLGVDCYVARRSLLGAKTSPLIELPVRPVKIDQQLSEFTVAELFGAPDPVKAIAAPEVVPSPVESFTVRLHAWRVNHYLLINTVEKGEAFPTDRLLMNILMALKHPVAQLPPADTLKWPMVKASHNKVVNPKQQASDMVQAYIVAHAEREPLKAVITMGDAALQLVVGNDDHAIYQHSKLGQLTVCAIDSLHDLLKNPERKSKAWACLKLLLG